MVAGAQAAAEVLHGIAAAAAAVVMVGEPLDVGGLIVVVDDESYARLGAGASWHSWCFTEPFL